MVTNRSLRSPCPILNFSKRYPLLHTQSEKTPPGNTETLAGLTVVDVRILHAEDAAAAEHHLVLRQGSRLVGEQVLDLAQVLGDVEGPALDPGVQLLVVQVQVVVDEVDLAQLHKLDGHVERDGDQHLVGGGGGWSPVEKNVEKRFQGRSSKPLLWTAGTHVSSGAAHEAASVKLTCRTMIMVQKTLKPARAGEA